MYNEHAFDPRIPLHRRSLRKYAGIMSVDDAIKAVNTKYDTAEAYDVAERDLAKRRAELVELQSKGIPANVSSAEREKRLKRINASVDRTLKPDTDNLAKSLKSVDASGEAFKKTMDQAKNPSYDPAYFGMDKEDVQKKLPKKPTPEQLARIDSTKLTLGQNLRALRHETKGLSYTPAAILKRGWQNMGSGGGSESVSASGGGWAGGPQAGRYLPLGSKALGTTVAFGDFKDSFNRADTAGEGRSRTERLGSAIGGTAGGIAGTLSTRTGNRLGWLNLPVSIGLGIGGFMGGAYVGSKAGKGVDKLVSRARGVSEGDYVQELRGRRGV